VNSHPDAALWRAFFFQKQQAAPFAELVAHLDACPQCRLSACAATEPYDCLGRPLVSVFPSLVPRPEAECFADRCSQRDGVLTVSAEWYAESYLHQLLRLAATRWRKASHAVHFAGTPFNKSQPPQCPLTGVAVLLDAPAYDELDEWMVPRPGRITVLCGLSDDWRAWGIAPQMTLTTPLPTDTIARLAPFAELLRCLFRHGDAQQRATLTANALGCDVPGEPQVPFQAIYDPETHRPLGWCSIAGQWLAWHALGGGFGKEIGAAHEALTSESHRRRFATRWRLRSSAPNMTGTIL